MDINKNNRKLNANLNPKKIDYIITMWIIINFLTSNKTQLALQIINVSEDTKIK